MKNRTWAILAILMVLVSSVAHAVDSYCYAVDGASLVGGDVVLMSDYESVSGSERGVLGLRILNLTTGDNRLITDPATEYPIGEIVSPDRQKVAFQPQGLSDEGTSVRIYDLVDGTLGDLVVPLNWNRTLSGYRWLPDSSGLMVAIYNSTTEHTALYTYRPGAELELVMDFAGARNFDLGDFSPDGTSVVFSNYTDRGNEVSELVWSTGELSLLTTFEDTLLYDLTWNSLGDRLMIEGFSRQFDGNVWVYEDEEVLVVDQIGDGPFDAMWSPYFPSLLAELVYVGDSGYDATYNLVLRDLDTGSRTDTFVGHIGDWFWFDQDHIMIMSHNTFSLFDIRDLSLTEVRTVCG